MFSRSIRIGRLFGIDIDLDYTWFIILLIITAVYGTQLIPRVVPNMPLSGRLVLGLLIALALFLSVLIHEFAHSLVAKSLGLGISGITLFLFGGVSRIASEPKSASVEFKVSAVGPLTSLALAGIFWGIAFVLPDTTTGLRAASEIFGFLGTLNVFLALFNLLPGFPLDGGRVLRAIIWGITGNFMHATRIAAYSGQAFGFLFIFLGILLFISVRGGALQGVFLGFIGWYLIQMAQSSQQQAVLKRTLTGVKVDSVMAKELTVVPAEATVDQAVNDYFMVYNYPAFPVKRDEDFLGLVALADIRQVPRERWPWVSIAEIVPPVKAEHVVKPDDDAWDALMKMSTEGVGRLLVMSDGRLAGILGRSHIIRLIRTRAELEA